MQLSVEFIQYAKKWESKINAFIETILENTSRKSAETQRNTRDSQISSETPRLSASARENSEELPFAVSDNIAVKGMSFTCGSKMLEHLRSPYTATVVQKLEEAGSAVIGTTNLDEFGMGLSTANSAFRKTNNPWDMARTPGGACGGSAAAVSAGIVPYALGADAGASLRLPAAFCGVAGLKPTYGAVSRHGLAAYASSMESIGVFADTIARCRKIFSLIRERDPLDQTSRDAPEAAPQLYPPANGGGAASGASKKIGVLSAQTVIKALEEAAQKSGNRELEAAIKACTPEDEVRRAFDLARERLSALGHTLVDIEIPGLHYVVPAFYTIAMAEASSNLTRFDGIRFGARPAGAENPDELIDNARAAGFGPEVKLQVLLGTLVLRSGFQEQYFLPAQKIRAGIKAAFEALLGDSDYKQQAKFDAILMPVSPARAFDFTAPPSAFAQKAACLYTCCASLAGLPALTFPASLEGKPPAAALPVGVQLVGRAWAEGTLLDIAEAYERQHPFPRPEGYKAFWN